MSRPPIANILQPPVFRGLPLPAPSTANAVESSPEPLDSFGDAGASARDLVGQMGETPLFFPHNRWAIPEKGVLQKTPIQIRQVGDPALLGIVQDLQAGKMGPAFGKIEPLTFTGTPATFQGELAILGELSEMAFRGNAKASRMLVEKGLKSRHPHLVHFSMNALGRMAESGHPKQAMKALEALILVTKNSRAFHPKAREWVFHALQKLLESAAFSKIQMKALTSLLKTLHGQSAHTAMESVQGASRFLQMQPPRMTQEILGLLVDSGLRHPDTRVSMEIVSVLGELALTAPASSAAMAVTILASKGRSHVHQTVCMESVEQLREVLLQRPGLFPEKLAKLVSVIEKPGSSLLGEVSGPSSDQGVFFSESFLPGDGYGAVHGTEEMSEETGLLTTSVPVSEQVFAPDRDDFGPIDRMEESVGMDLGEMPRFENPLDALIDREQNLEIRWMMEYFRGQFRIHGPMMDDIQSVIDQQNEDDVEQGEGRVTAMGDALDDEGGRQSYNGEEPFFEEPVVAEPINEDSASREAARAALHGALLTLSFREFGSVIGGSGQGKVVRDGLRISVVADATIAGTTQRTQILEQHGG